MPFRPCCGFRETLINPRQGAGADALKKGSGSMEQPVVFPEILLPLVGVLSARMLGALTSLVFFFGKCTNAGLGIAGAHFHGLPSP